MVVRLGVEYYNNFDISLYPVLKVKKLTNVSNLKFCVSIAAGRVIQDVPRRMTSVDMRKTTNMQVLKIF